MLFSNCFVCCKKVKLEAEVDKKRKLICEQFLVLMSRYLNLNRDHYGSEKTLDIKPGPGKMKNGKRRGKRRKLFSCDHCLPLIESVCAIYKDWSVLQVKLNGSIKLMADLMQDASASIVDCAIEVTEDFEEAIDFRIRFIKQALNKLNSKDFPHLALKRLSTDFISSNVLSKEKAVSKTTTAVPSRTDCKVELKQEVDVDLDIGDFDAGSPDAGIWEPNSDDDDDDDDVEMEQCENDDDDDDYHDEGNGNEMETLKRKDSQKRKKMKKKVSLRIDLRAHEKIHKEGKANQFQCAVCSKFFLQRADCSYHIRRVHKGKGDVLRGGVKWQPEPKSDNTKKNEQRKRTLKCQFCPRSFRRGSDRTSHEKTHRNKPFKCPHCEMTFKQLGVFTVHVDKHLKPYQCGVCGTRFGNRNNCRNHQSIVHQVIDGVILKITEQGTTNEPSRPGPSMTNEANANQSLNVVDDPSADKASETLEPLTIKSDIVLEPTSDNENEFEADNAIAEDADSNSADIWQPGSDEEADDDDDANNAGPSQRKDASTSVPVKKGGVTHKRKRNRMSNREIAELRSKDPLPFKCEECGKGFPTPSMMKSHKRVAHAGIQLQCETCGAQFKHMSSFNRHLAAKRCEKILSRANANAPNPANQSRYPRYPVQAEVDADPLPLKCTECEEAFAVHGDLRRHRKTVHNKGVLYRCHICEKLYSDLYQMKQHLNSHANSKPHTCRFCFQKSFNRDTGRRYHERACDANPMKDDLKKHKCDICGKGFKQPSKLQQHAFVVHGAPKPPPPEPKESRTAVELGRDVICEKCGKVFPFPNHKALYRHTIEEHGEEYPCSVCGKVCTSRRYLHIHERTHKDPSYQCAHCGDKFAWDTSCRNHIRRMHKGQPNIVINLLKTPNPIDTLSSGLPPPTGAPDTASEDTPENPEETPVEIKTD